VATPDFTAGSIMDSSAALLNDSVKEKYTYVVQLPYLKIALTELRELFELNNLPITNATSSILVVPAGTVLVGFNTSPALPTNLVEIQKLWERESGVGGFVPMTKREFLPAWDPTETTSAFDIWSWQQNFINVLPSSRINDLKMDYIAQLFNTTIDENSNIGVIDAQNFLWYRTAGLCAEYIDEDTDRADRLNSNAGGALDRITGIKNKGKQSIITRHKPFRAGYKRRGRLA